jgi:hypothetical protein
MRDYFSAELKIMIQYGVAMIDTTKNSCREVFLERANSVYLAPPPFPRWYFRDMSRQGLFAR